MSEATMEQTNPPMSETPPQSPSLAEAPTYVQDTWSGLTRYVCLLCGHQEWADVTMTQHMQQFHQGSMIAATAGLGPEGAASASVAASEESAGQTAETATPEPAASAEAPAPAEAG